MRKKTIAANWKANASLIESRSLIEAILQGSWSNDREVILAPPFPYLHYVKGLVENSQILLAAQDCSVFSQGAYTGEVCADMIKDLGASYVIIGHSERRDYFGENNLVFKEKITRALESGLKVIFCFGESLEEREEASHFERVSEQLDVLKEVKGLNENNCLLAYEPVWAIGTGRTASSDQAEEMHRFVRAFLEEEFSKTMALNTTILYGGSVKAQNAKELFDMPNIDGGLIGGASLHAEDFLSIIRS